MKNSRITVMNVGVKIAFRGVKSRCFTLLPLARYTPSIRTNSTVTNYIVMVQIQKVALVL